MEEISMRSISHTIAEAKPSQSRQHIDFMIIGSFGLACKFSKVKANKVIFGG
jgi:hypothetical protein